MPAQKRKRKTSKSAAPKPLRREIGSLIAFLTAVFLFLVLGGVDAVVINFLRSCVGLLIGRGLVLLPFALLGAAVILLFHRGRPVASRVTALLLSPVLFGSLMHLFSFQDELPEGWAFWGELAAQGRALNGGGVLSGGLAVLLKAGLSRVGAAIVLMVVLIALLLIAFQYSIVRLVDDIRERLRSRAPYEPEPEPAPRPQRVRDPKLEPPSKPVRKPKKSDIDVPLYLTDDQMKDEPAAAQAGILRERAVKTPAEALLEPPKPVELPQVFAFGKPTFISPDTGEIIDGPDKPSSPPAAPLVQDDTPPWEADAPLPANVVPLPVAPAPSPTPLAGNSGSYRTPPMDLLSPPKPIRETEINEDLRMGAARLVEVLESFGLGVQIINITRGPSVTRYELEMESGLKLAKLTGLSTDIALAMGSESVNISPIPNKMSVVGVEVPNRVTSMVTLREVMESQEFQASRSPTTFAVGRDIGGRNIVGDIAKMPHLLVAGSTGAGKSVCVNALIVSLLYKASPEDLKLILIDPKKVEFPPYNGVPHLFVPVITDAAKAAGTLEWAVMEMEKRYATLADCGKRDIDGYNAVFENANDPDHPKMSRIVIIVDEMADLIMESKKERNMENFIVRIAQKARACGIHLVLATQRPDAKVITGLIKANVPSRIALKVAGAVNSRIVLDRPGAEKLIGHGDMLFAPAGVNNPARVQGCYVDERDIHKIVAFIKENSTPSYSEEIMNEIDRHQAKAEGVPMDANDASDDHDPMLPAAIEVILDSGQGSVSFLQRRLKLGYARAARLMDMMEERGIVGPFEGSKPRKILVTREQWENMSS